MLIYRPLLGDFTGRVIQNAYGYIEYRYGPALTCEIVNIEVNSSVRGRGHGTALLNILLRQTEFSKLYAFTRSNNEIAQIWYLKNKFTLTLIPNYYVEGDAYLCVRPRVLDPSEERSHEVDIQLQRLCGGRRGVPGVVSRKPPHRRT